MTITIDDPALDKAVAATAQQKGVSVEQYVLDTLKRAAELERRQALDKLLAEFAAAPVLDPRPMDELLGYNEAGTFD